MGILDGLYERFKNLQKFQTNDQAYYRMIGGDPGLKDLQTSGVVRAKPGGGYSEASFNLAYPEKWYKGKYMVEYKPPVNLATMTKDSPMDAALGFDKSIMKVDESRQYLTPKKPIKISDPYLKLYKRGLFKEFKEINKTYKPSRLPQFGGSVFRTAKNVLREMSGPLAIMNASQILTNAPSSNPTVGYNPAQETEMRARQVDEMYLQEAKKRLIASEGPAGLRDQRRVYGLAQKLKQQFENQPRTQPQLQAR